MDTPTRQVLITTILTREKLRPLTRIARLLQSPWRTIPYYLLATLGHVHPFPITFNTLWNTRMSCYLPEGNTFYYYGYCEANLTNFFIRYVREGMTIIDVGAHVGIYSMLGSELVGKTGNVHSFEPTPRTGGLLSKNTAGLGNVTVQNLAVAEVAGTVTFADYGPGYGAYNSASTAGAQDITRTPTRISVNSIRLDDYCSEHHITPSLLKIDAEGFEYEVLKGASALLSKSTPRPLITIEVAGGSGWADNRTATFTLLNEHRYVPYEIKPDGTLKPHELKDAALYTYDNLLFIPEERKMEVVTELS
ncbi:FkbM family methyltransferase [Patescibacteria group bacterium]|nr:FkbM family methyltransferase [Patescibacteria group bacterium]